MTGLQAFLAILALAGFALLMLWLERRSQARQGALGDERMDHVLLQLREDPVVNTGLVESSDWMDPDGRLVPTEQWGPMVTPPK